MAKQVKARTSGAYVIKAAESRPTKVVAKSAKSGRSQSKPSADDKRLARAFLKQKRG